MALYPSGVVPLRAGLLCVPKKGLAIRFLMYTDQGSRQPRRRTRSQILAASICIAVLSCKEVGGSQGVVSVAERAFEPRLLIRQCQDFV